MLRPEHCWYTLVLAFKDGNTTWSHAWGQPLSLHKEVLKPPSYKSCGYQKTLGSPDTPPASLQTTACWGCSLCTRLHRGSPHI